MFSIPEPVSPLSAANMLTFASWCLQTQLLFYTDVRHREWEFLWLQSHTVLYRDFGEFWEPGSHMGKQPTPLRKGPKALEAVTVLVADP
jgi:hypothetical protein